MNIKKILTYSLAVLLFLFGIAVLVINILLATGVIDLDRNDDHNNIVVDNNNSVVTNTKALMLLIEFEGTEGLVNFVNDMNSREIPGLLLVDSSFVSNNCSVIRTLMDQGLEIGGVYPVQPFWDMPYEDQYQIMMGAKGKIENCTGEPLKIFGSKYFAYDENTIKAAEELSIDVVLARGTTGARATIYQPEEYDVKIFSVSNVSSEKWGTGSLCDYSYWAREGSASQFATELRVALQEPKISPVSHTYIGGLKKSWNDVYLEFFDSNKIDWVSVDEFLNVDVNASFEDIPQNREVQYDTPKPLIPLEDEENVNNPCSIDELVESTDEVESEVDTEALMIYHNGTGPMCLEALDFFNDNGIEYVEMLNTESGFYDAISELKDKYIESEGVSEDFGYYPIIEYQGRVFSGFDSQVSDEISELAGL